MKKYELLIKLFTIELDGQVLNAKKKLGLDIGSESVELQLSLIDFGYCTHRSAETLNLDLVNETIDTVDAVFNGAKGARNFFLNGVEQAFGEEK